MNPLPSFIARLRFVFSLIVASLALGALGGPAQAIPPRKPSIVYERATRPVPYGNGAPRGEWQRELLILSNGTWSAGEASGVLSAAELTTLKRTIARTRFAIDRGNYPICTGFPSRVVRVTAGAKKLQWSTPCARQPVASFLKLEELVTSLTIARYVRVVPVVPIEPTPPLVPIQPIPPVEPVHVEPAPVVRDPSPVLLTYRVDSMYSGRDSEAITVRYDGTWTKGGGLRGESGSGMLAPAEVAALKKSIDNATWGSNPKRYECAARLDGEALLNGDGHSYRWSVPCGQPHPSLSAIISQLRQLTSR